MTHKLLEIRDRGTCIPALAIEVSGADGFLARRAGFGQTACIYLIALATQKCAYDPWSWGNRTMNTAHQHIERAWHQLNDGDVVDVQFLLGETTAPKVSESVRESACA